MLQQNNDSYGYRCIIPLSMCYFGFSIMASSLVHKYIQINSSTISAGSIVMPFWFVLSDVITEVYGYRLARRMLWSLMLVEFIFYLSLQVFAIVQVDQGPSGAPYYFVFGSMMRTYFAVWASLFFANFLNTYFMAKLKILFYSRHFWFRSILASASGEVLYTVIGFYAILGGTVSNTTLFWLVYWGCVLKIVVTALSVFPASIFIAWLKRVEGIDAYDVGVNFNPFKVEF